MADQEHFDEWLSEHWPEFASEGLESLKPEHVPVDRGWIIKNGCGEHNDCCCRVYIRNGDTVMEIHMDAQQASHMGARLFSASMEYGKAKYGDRGI